VEQLRKPAGTRGDTTDVLNADHGVLGKLEIHKSSKNVEYLQVTCDMQATTPLKVRFWNGTKHVDQDIKVGDTIPKGSTIVGADMQKLLRHEHANLQDEAGFVQLNKHANTLEQRLGTDQDALLNGQNTLVQQLNDIQNGIVPTGSVTQAGRPWKTYAVIGTGTTVAALGTAAAMNDRTDKTRANKLAEDRFKNETPGDIKAEAETLNDLTKGMGYAQDTGLGKVSESSRLNLETLNEGTLTSAGFTYNQQTGLYEAPAGELRYTKVTLADGTQEFKTVLGVNVQTQQLVYGNIIHVGKNASGEPTFAFRNASEAFSSNRLQGGLLGSGFGTSKAEAPITTTIQDAQGQKMTLGINQGGLVKAEKHEVSQAVGDAAFMKEFGTEAQAFVQTTEGKNLLELFRTSGATYTSSVSPNYGLNVVTLGDGNQLIVSSSGVSVRTPENPQTGAKASLKELSPEELKQFAKQLAGTTAK
ncbi:MAG: hypothetical protein ACKO37_05945, partial [Vampirovibrionales bacterium]